MARKIAQGLWQLTDLGNVFIVEHDGLVIVDAGVGKKTDNIIAAIGAAGRAIASGGTQKMAAAARRYER